MKACATHCKLPSYTTGGNLFFPVPDTKFHDFLLQIDELVEFAPEILEAIENDQDELGKKKKRVRRADNRFAEEMTEVLPGIQIEDYTVKDYELILETGRPRMPAYLVCVFLMMRGKDGSVTKARDATFREESMSLYVLLQERGYNLPAQTTILENINAVSNETRDMIFEKQLRFILREELDDYKKLFIDSTHVEANSAWPTDSRILTGLLKRCHRMGQYLEEAFGLPNFHPGWMNLWLRKMKSLDFKINMTAGKPKSKGKVKNFYRELLKYGRKSVKHLDKELEQFEEKFQPFANLFPSRREMLHQVLHQMREDIGDAYKVIRYTEERIFEEKTKGSRDKVLSLSDKTAAYIKKGSREPVIGYKPQIGRSEHGFITSLIVEEGNPADSTKLIPVFQDAVSRTGVMPDMVSADDGYAWGDGRDHLLGCGVSVMSLSGSKGKKLIGEEDWESEKYQDARDDRSVVESLIFVLKYCYYFGRMGRRGLEAVRAEMREKALAYNCCRIIHERQKKRRQQLQRAA
jgi:hypothetical protein